MWGETDRHDRIELGTVEEAFLLFECLMPLVSRSDLVNHAIAGKIVSFPTDTVPALAAQPEQSDLIFNLKKRSLSKPLILMGASWTDLLPYLSGSREEFVIWEALANRYFPGALTLILPASFQVPEAINPRDRDTIGIRVPAHETACKILAQTGPLATTSANLSDDPPIEDLAVINERFREVFTLDPNQLEIAEQKGSGKPSTVVKWTGNDWSTIRRGSVYFQ
ncbi:MAG: L-threonylcarbamoyladenylate synthase [Microcystaceae cyanobacterium]